MDRQPACDPEVGNFAERLRESKGQETRVPEFSSREEEAASFDPHDLAEYQDEFTTVKVRLRKNLSADLHIRPDEECLPVALPTCAVRAGPLPLRAVVR